MNLLYEGRDSSVWENKGDIFKIDDLQSITQASAEIFNTLYSDHPNIVRAKQVWLYPKMPEPGMKRQLQNKDLFDRPSFMLQLPKGKALEDITSLDSKQVIKVLSDILCGLRAIHTGAHMVHSDLKPANVLVVATDQYGRDNDDVRRGSQVRAMLMDLGQMHHDAHTRVHGTGGFYEYKWYPLQVQDLLAFAVVGLDTVLRHDSELKSKDARTLKELFGVRELIPFYLTHTKSLGKLADLARGFYIFLKQAEAKEPLNADQLANHLRALLLEAQDRVSDDLLQPCQPSPGQALENMREKFQELGRTYAKDNILGIGVSMGIPEMKMLAQNYCKDRDESYSCAMNDLQVMRDLAAVHPVFRSKVMSLWKTSPKQSSDWAGRFILMNKVPMNPPEATSDFFDAVKMYSALLNDADEDFEPEEDFETKESYRLSGARSKQEARKSSSSDSNSSRASKSSSSSSSSASKSSSASSTASEPPTPQMVARAQAMRNRKRKRTDASTY